jgi:adenylate cyclase
MAIECERKFLVTSDAWRAGARPVTIRQGYLADAGHVAVRVRIAGDRAFLTVKGGRLGISRLEFEYGIPVADADAMLALCQRPLIEKVRYVLDHAGREWVVDVFEGDNAGLVVAEVELERPDEPFAMPEWAGAEVTTDSRYLNVNLGRHPYRAWRT